MKIKKLLIYVCCVVIGIAFFSFGLKAQTLHQSISLNTKPTHSTEIFLPDFVKESEFFTKTNVSILKQPMVITASTDASQVMRFACEPRDVEVYNYDAGMVAYCRKKNFPIAENDSARVEIKSGASRTPHWHDTWEEQILLSGKAKTVIIDSKGKVFEETLEPGMIFFIPQGWTHWSEAVGNETASFLLVFPAGFQTFELSDSIVNLNPKLMESIIGLKLSNFKQNKDAIVRINN
ncbi:cupin domain-containing protein [Geminocystis sp. GBBB08]|uniref:cupin domain-containing protein n=1 Tax=Geminocystis sp. GBBB08 TaxID=2604140 RepID=UPI0027E3431D|nr:cupin domain-containing protein [Geminocystis sp. GBBB08]MBL1209881.1 cupin domain-containing protein [Geminocystis sp. GBBB08]